MNLKRNPIGVFDSGMGGISVLKEITAYMPHENYIYVGDSANAPYGMRPVEEVRRLTVTHIQNLVENHQVKAVAVACNTATSAAVALLREMYPSLPLVGVEPAVKPAVLADSRPRVLVMATPRTLKEEKFLNLERIYENRAEILPLPCPGLMEYVEKGILDGQELHQFLHSLLDPYKDKGLTSIVLGCTHYPFLKNAISEIAGADVRLFDGGEGTARELLRRVREAGLLRDDYDDAERGKIVFYNTSEDKSLPERSLWLFRYDNPLADRMDLITESRSVFPN